MQGSVEGRVEGEVPTLDFLVEDWLKLVGARVLREGPQILRSGTAVEVGAPTRARRPENRGPGEEDGGEGPRKKEESASVRTSSWYLPNDLPTRSGPGLGTPVRLGCSGTVEIVASVASGGSVA